MGPEPLPSVSVVVINKDDRRIVDTLVALEDVAAASPGDLEIVVVDASAGALDDIRERFGAVRWLPFAPDPVKPTIPEQRNVGVARSHGEVVVFIDAGCVPQPGWLASLLEPIAAGPETIVAGAHRSAGPSGIRDEATRLRLGQRYLREAPTINLAISRRVFAVVGCFDESFHYGSDVDFTWRATDAGFRVRYAPEAVVTHDWGDLRSELRRSYLYGQARLRLYQKHRRRRRRLLRDDPTMVVYPAFLVVLPCAAVYPAVLGLLVVPVLKNLRHHPVLTVTHHLVYASGVLTALGRRSLVGTEVDSRRRPAEGRVKL